MEKARGPSTQGTDRDTPGSERIAKVIARAGVASRRDAERLIAEGKVTLNGKPVTSPALNVAPTDRITVAGVPLAPPDPPRLWLYHKPTGLVTTARDEKGRETVFDRLPADMPRVMPIGRLDLNSEGLLLLTNDGALKRRLELPSTGWLRRYRVRVNGRPEDAQLAPLRAGITVEGERFQPMTVTLDRQQGANAWLTVGLREGRNREIRRALAAVGLVVNRLIRIAYGPFRLEDLPAGEAMEVRPKVLRDQLGGLMPGLPARAEADGSARRRTSVATKAGTAKAMRVKTAGTNSAGSAPPPKSGASAPGPGPKHPRTLPDGSGPRKGGPPSRPGRRQP